MSNTEVITLVVRDMVSKTFHITADEIVLHTDLDLRVMIVPESYRPEIMKLVEEARKYADEHTVVEEINVHSETGNHGEQIQEIIGDPVNNIWEEMVKSRQ